MEKKFFEAFPNLKLEGVQKDLFEQVVVEKITATKRKDLLRVYIRSERLIDKEAVFAVEREIKKQFFPKEFMVIKIYEHFLLSGQYNPQKLMEVYRESILLELKECEHMLYMMFRQAEMAFLDNNTMELVLENSVIAKSKEDQLICILDKVLNERCGFQVRFQVDYKEVQTGNIERTTNCGFRKLWRGLPAVFMQAAVRRRVQQGRVPRIVHRLERQKRKQRNPLRQKRVQHKGGQYKEVQHKMVQRKKQRSQQVLVRLLRIEAGRQRKERVSSADFLRNQIIQM